MTQSTHHSISLPWSGAPVPWNERIDAITWIWVNGSETLDYHLSAIKQLLSEALVAVKGKTVSPAQFTIIQDELNVLSQAIRYCESRDIFDPPDRLDYMKSTTARSGPEL